MVDNKKISYSKTFSAPAAITFIGIDELKPLIEALAHIVYSNAS
jgi:hypothetical protein